MMIPGYIVAMPDGKPLWGYCQIITVYPDERAAESACRRLSDGPIGKHLSSMVGPMHVTPVRLIIGKETNNGTTSADAATGA